MSFKNYVCVTCGQDFTRNYSAIRHNRLLHQQTGKIVRTLEYIIGRVNGVYLPADPILFRRKRREHTANDGRSNFPFVRVAHDSDGSQRGSKIIQKPKESIQEAHDEPAKAYSAEQPGSELYLLQQRGNASVLDEKLHELRMLKALDVRTLATGSGERVAEKELLRVHRSFWDLPEVAIIKLSEINQLMLRYENEVFVWKYIEYLGNEHREKKDISALHAVLDYYRKKYG